MGVKGSRALREAQAMGGVRIGNTKELTDLSQWRRLADMVKRLSL
jgi:hypothetical protein